MESHAMASTVIALCKVAIGHIPSASAISRANMPARSMNSLKRSSISSGDFLDFVEDAAAKRVKRERLFQTTAVQCGIRAMS
jgi:hypothetical protein